MKINSKNEFTGLSSAAVTGRDRFVGKDGLGLTAVILLQNDEVYMIKYWSVKVWCAVEM